ncbi:MAG: acyltransferase family protein [Lachnospiraceae bacterium]
MQTSNIQTAAMPRRRNGGIDFWKFIFSVVIIIFHFSENVGDRKHGPFMGGAIAVEFFFVVSGFLMAASAKKYTENNDSIGTNTRLFLFHKMKGMFPELAIAWGIGFIVMHLKKTDLTFVQIIKDFLTGMWELFFLQFSGLSDFRANTVTWYISAMLLAMLLLVPLLLKNRELFLNVLAPGISIFLLGYLCASYGNLHGPSDWLGFCYKGFPRAIAELCLGCVCFLACEHLKQVHLTTFSKVLLAIIELGGYLFMLIFCFHHGGSKLDFAMLFAVAISITITFSQQSVISDLFAHSIFSWLGKFSFSMFLGHRYWCSQMPKLFCDTTYRQNLLIYAVLVLVTSTVIYGLSEWIRKMQPKITPKIKPLFFTE